jgi:hypothetical protein
MTIAHCRIRSLQFLCLALALASTLAAQDTPRTDTPKLLKPLQPDDWATKEFQLKYIDPDEIRDIFSDRSFVMEADSDLKVLTAHGSPAFLKEVEDAVKRFDVPPPAAANFQITVYLLTVAAEAPTGVALPKELTQIGKDLAAAGAQGLRLADSQTMRVREGQPGEAAALLSAPSSSKLSRVKIQSASLLPGAKTPTISLNGLSVWLDILPVAPETARPSPGAAADVAVDIDVDQDKAVLVSKAGVDKPVVVVVRAGIVH